MCPLPAPVPPGDSGQQALSQRSFLAIFRREDLRARLRESLPSPLLSDAVETFVAYVAPIDGRRSTLANNRAWCLTHLALTILLLCSYNFLHCGVIKNE